MTIDEFKTKLDNKILIYNENIKTISNLQYVIDKCIVKSLILDLSFENHEDKKINIESHQLLSIIQDWTTQLKQINNNIKVEFEAYDIKLEE